MDYVRAAFEAVAVSLCIGLVGFWALRRRILTQAALPVLSALALDVAIPCQVFTQLVRGFDPAAPGWWRLPLWWAAFTAGAALLTALCAPAFAPPRRRECLAALFYQNGIFVPLVLLTQMFGRESPHLVNLFLFTMGFPAFFFNTQHLFFARRAEPFRWRRLVTAVFAATCLALAARFSGADRGIPRFVLDGLSLVGDMAAPALLLLLGGVMQADWERRKSAPRGEVAKVVVLKNVVFPLAALAVVAWLRPPRDVALLLVLQGAVPPITALPLTAEREGGDRAFLSAVLVASFAASAVTLPLAIGLFFRLYP